MNKKHSKMQSIMIQFSYDHQKLDSNITKIGKNVEDLTKILDSMNVKKVIKKKNKFF